MITGAKIRDDECVCKKTLYSLMYSFMSVYEFSLRS